MDAIYLYLELVALAILAWLCRDKLISIVAKPSASKETARTTVKPRPHRTRAPLRSRRLRHNRSSLAR
ncbi:hypothetical protein AWB80_02459 [Caballeronia pedi]|uniref:Uncharacterized protein n=1 Tax=Caballeronia pedi TaxID=1777141 RepID=A0A158AMB8_9BURK|nr:hypothetical protein AWB80_02459 [Caballeronia pedi]